MKRYTIIGTTVLILALITVSITTATAISCTCGDICVNETGWWRDSGAFHANATPIQAAADNATAGEIICVKAGDYNEAISIETAHLTLAGEGADVVNVTSVGPDDHVFEVAADYVNISGFNVTGTTKNFGIYLNGADHCIVSDNAASNNKYRGIYLDSSSSNRLLNNTASKNDCGIELWSSSNNILKGNTANLNYYDGIYLDSSSNNTLLNNTVSKNDCGIELWSSSNNILKGNTANLNYYDGIYLDSSSNNTLLNNTASKNDYGIELWSSSNNILKGNTANLNYYDGIYLDSSSNNTLPNNTASKNDYGIELNDSSNNTLTGSTASGNHDGINLYDSSDNLIYNNYWDNTNNAYDDGSNRWNITTITAEPNIIGGPSIGGNYWSDYNGTDTDGDGLGEETYNIGSGNFDYHPLCPPSVKGDLNGDGILTPADAAIALHLVATGAHDDATDVSGDGQVTSLDALMILQAAAGMVEL
ncbi:MAG: hypothetical protein C4B59_06135 [Candidatus Methanogaster sp.]|uniref:Uncharacterized protein n=1 Tax=Candidatus Methanogaster sp. TaxID=3386292 RepID=A0AC61L4D6_9EURY|nr:MAG: hypothetical protein C4B59_06135 [ANME-2 cluster archaeon]